MPMGKGTYGSKVGRPKKKKTNVQIYFSIQRTLLILKVNF